MDPSETPLSKIGLESVEAGLQMAQRFLEKILGPAAEEFGLMFQERLRLYRLGNALNVMKKAQAMLEEAGINPKMVPPRTFLPLFENASLEEDETLQGKWAALLANAANPNRPSDVPPAFAEILKELSGADAKLLDGVYDEIASRLATPGLTFETAHAGILKGCSSFYYDQVGELYAQLGLTKIPWVMTIGQQETFGSTEVRLQKSQFATSVGNLVRLGLLSREREVDFSRVITGVDPSRVISRSELDSLARKLEYTDRLLLSELGMEFVRACRKPSPQVS